MAVARVLLNKDAWFHVPRTPRVAELSNRLRLKCVIILVLPLVHPLRARCFARCCTTPVLADELEYREKPLFFPLPPFPLGGRLIPSGHTEKGEQEFKTEWGYTARYTLVKL